MAGSFGSAGVWRKATKKESLCCDRNAKNSDGSPYNPKCASKIRIGDWYYDTKESSQSPYATLKWCKPCAEMHGHKQEEGTKMTATAVKKDQATVEAMMYAATGDPDAKRMGPAKDGGLWYKNYYNGTLYRMDEDGKGGYEVKEKRASKLPAAVAKKEAKQQAVRDKMAGKPAPKASKAPKATEHAETGSRKALMQEAKERGRKYYRVMNKAELSEVLKKGTSEARIKEIQDGATARWQAGWKFNKTGKEA